MSQKETKIPGLGQAEHAYRKSSESMHSAYGSQRGSEGSKAYQRGGQNHHATRVPGMEAPLNEEPVRQKSRPMTSGKPVVGFLYSVSRTAVGEYWPLHIGPNTIGQGPENDVQLLEGTVSWQHAELSIIKQKNPQKVIASIRIIRPTNDTQLNGMSLGFAAQECKNGDLITVGESYELYLLLVDSAELGLSVKDNFMPVETEIEDEDNETDFLNEVNNRSTRSEGYTRPNDSGYVPSNATVGINGQGATFGGKGGTEVY